MKPAELPHGDRIKRLELDHQGNVKEVEYFPLPVEPRTVEPFTPTQPMPWRPTWPGRIYEVWCQTTPHDPSHPPQWTINTAGECSPVKS